MASIASILEDFNLNDVSFDDGNGNGFFRLMKATWNYLMKAKWNYLTNVWKWMKKQIWTLFYLCH